MKRRSPPFHCNVDEPVDRIQVGHVIVTQLGRDASEIVQLDRSKRICEEIQDDSDRRRDHGKKTYGDGSTFFG